MSNKNDQYKLVQARAWLAQNRGSGDDWNLLTIKLCSDLAAALDILSAHWGYITAAPEDAKTAIKGLLDALDRQWDPHLFDRIAEEVATTLGLADFDSVSYRGERLDDWRRVAAFFLDRKSAEDAVRRVIHQELLAKFGPAPS